MRASPAVDQQCGYVPSTPNPLARAHSAQRPGVAVTRRLITSTNKMLHPNRPALIPGSIPPTCTSRPGEVKVVLDTNLLASGFVNFTDPTTLSSAILQAWRAELFELVVSEYILA